jgi:RHS repeat-associated protein
VSIILDTGGNALAKTMTYSYNATYQLTTGLDLTTTTESYFAEVDQTTAQTGAINLITAGTTARSVETGYSNDPSYRARNILGLPIYSIIKDSAGQAVAKSETVYDEFASYPLLTYGDLGAEDYNDPGTTARGLATTVRRYVDVGANLSLATHAQYDQCGNLKVFTNERGVQTLTDYSATYKHAYATQATTAAPDPSGQQGSSAGFTSTSTYDYTTGLALTATDANGQVTNFVYKDSQNNPDPLNRLRKVTRPDGGWTRYDFNDVVGNLYASTETKQDDTHTVKAYQYFDTMGRASRAFMSEGVVNNVESYIVSDTKYDQMGRVCKGSNPYRMQALGGISTTGDCAAAANWTTTTYDALGRAKQVTLPDGTTVQSEYAGIYTTVTDQAGKQRRQVADALGRIARVDEPDLNGSLGAVDAPAQATAYEYDVLGNLIHIQQGTSPNIQHRYFKYDSLSRLTYERQVEQAAPLTASDATGNSQWSRRIVYDENGYQGLVTGQYDARNIHTQFTYDNLNRITGISYSDGVTPSVSYVYDKISFTNSQDARTIYNLGRLAEVQTPALGSLPATAQSYNYDLMGRVANNRQTVGTNSYSMIYGYNAGGALNSERYPSGRVVNYEYGEAGRLNSVASGSTIYASQFKYEDPRGLLSSFALGNGGNVATQSYAYNSRLQLSSIQLAKSGAVLQRYEYKYGRVNTDGTVDETKNNGQIASIDSFIGADKQWQQRYEYDALGRLKRAGEYRGDNNQLSYQMNYDYDEFGNRYQAQATNPNSLAFVPVEDTHLNKANNRFNAGLGITYDDAGNITSDSRFTAHQYLYDANNRQRQVAQPDGTGAVTSVYDGTGQRVAQMTGTSVDNVLVYDAGGKLVAEYGETAVNRGTSYVFTDHQSSTRVVLDSSGTVTSRHDYQVFGEEIGAGVGQRTAGQKYGQVDSARQKYAGMEDDGSGMSHTQWRKYDSQSGRWTSPDPYSGSMTIGDPQSFNRYNYVNNDPVNLVDPSGLMAGADQGWSGAGFWGSSLGFDEPHHGGPGIIREAMENHDSLVKARTDGMLAQHYLDRNEFSAAERIFQQNPDIGLYVDGIPLWGELAAAFISGYREADAGMTAHYDLGSLMKKGWDAVYKLLSSIRDPDFVVVFVSMHYGTSRAIARGDSLEDIFTNPMVGYSVGTGSGLSLAFGWIIQLTPPGAKFTRSWLSGVSFEASGFWKIGGGFVYSATSTPHWGVMGGFGIGGKGLSMSGSDTIDGITKRMKELIGW